MLQQGRGIDNEFTSQERLFLRCLADYIAGNKLLAAGMKFPPFPKTSVNREKHGLDEDVLVPIYCDWGVAAFRVKDIPETLRKGDGQTVLVKPEHDPELTNYAHSEIRVYENGESEERTELSKPIKKLFRGELAKKAIVIKQASISIKEWNQCKNERYNMKKRLEIEALKSSASI
jgi:hypothetical protein